MNKLHAVIGLFMVIALVWLFAHENETTLGPTPIESQMASEDGLLMAIAYFDSDGDATLPEDWETVTVADCAHFAPPAAVKQAALINPNGWTAQQLCAWMLSNSDLLYAEIERTKQYSTDSLDARFPQGAFDSPYQDFSTAELEVAAPNDGVASYVLATRLQYIDRKRSDELFIQSAVQTGLPGPLMAAVFARGGVNFTRDPNSGSVAYADPDDVFRAAVLAMTVKQMGYDFRQADFFMEHVAKAMGPDSTDAVFDESRRLYEQISMQGASRE